jgi:alpha/beta superfamily hydrolase
MLPSDIELHLYDGAEETLPCVGDAVTIAGPAGPIEAISACPSEGQDMHAVGVICHPHPLYGGSLHNKVVHYLSQTLNDLGLGTLRFNFRGVGASGGVYDQGNGETDDLLAVIDWVRNQRPHHELWLAGFSFGAYVALRAAARHPPPPLITQAPPVNFFDFQTLEAPGCPWLLVQGDRDEVVPAAEVMAWSAARPTPPQSLVLEGADHFFHGKLNLLRDRLMAALSKPATASVRTGTRL